MSNIAKAVKKELAAAKAITMSNNNLTAEQISRFFNAPFVYDEHSQYILDRDGNTILELRGWGNISSKITDGLEAAKIQDAIGHEIAAALSQTSMSKPTEAKSYVESSSVIEIGEFEKNGNKYKISVGSDRTFYECVNNRLASYFCYHPKLDSTTPALNEGTVDVEKGETYVKVLELLAKHNMEDATKIAKAIYLDFSEESKPAEAVTDEQLFDEIDFELMVMEGYTHGAEGKRITELRGKIAARKHAAPTQLRSHDVWERTIDNRINQLEACKVGHTPEEVAEIETRQRDLVDLKQFVKSLPDEPVPDKR
jgi:hypothetical protein